MHIATVIHPAAYLAAKQVKKIPNAFGCKLVLLLEQKQNPHCQIYILHIC